MPAGTDDPWPFNQAPNVAAIATVKVLEHGSPILVVIHYADDPSWAFLCGAVRQHADGVRVTAVGAMS